MRTPKVYLETSVFNHYFDPNSYAREATIALFEDIKAGRYEAFTSLYVTDELNAAQEPKKSNMLALITDYNVKVLDVSEEASDLAEIYVRDKMIPEKYRTDGLHIACATVNDMELIFSLNFKHINKVKTKIMTANINVWEGYKPISILSPMEVMDDDDAPL